MSQTNSNNSHVDSNDSSNILDGSVSNPSLFSTSSDLSTSTDAVTTILGQVIARNASGVDSATENGNYEVATALASGLFIDGSDATARNGSALFVTNAAGNKVAFSGNSATLLANNVANVNFLPTEQVAKTEWAAAGTAGSYLTGASWTAAPKLTGTASAFTLSNTNDGGKTLIVSESISGSPLTTGNGSFNEALTFRGANDSLAIKHNVAVVNVPAVTNNNNANALDVRNESYAETYVKQGVSSNYAWNSAHKSAEANGNQTLNDAFAETYAYKDAGLTINSSVKTSVADAAYINGSERIAESRAANYGYKAASGSVDYVITDTRNLAQADQRTWTNTTVTNVANFKVVDNTNGTTITAKGLITGTTDNLSTAKSAATPTTFNATNAEFKVDSANYSLVVDSKEFSIDHVNTIDNGENALLALVNETAKVSTGGDVFNSALGTTNAAAGVSMADAFNPYVSTVGAVAGARLDGTQFNDIITVKDSATTPFNALIDAGAGNDKITGGFGNDNINGGAGNDTIDGGAGDDTINVTGTGADTIIVGAGNDTITGFTLGEDSLTVTKGTATAKVTITFADNTQAKYIVTGNTNADVVIPTKNADGTTLTKAGLDAIAGVKAENIFDFSSSTTGVTLPQTGQDNSKDDVMIGGSGNDVLNGGKGADKLTGNAGNDTFKFTDLTNGLAARVDTITDFTAGDKIDVSALGFKSFIGTTAFTTANATNALRFDTATNTLQGSTNADVKAELEVALTGVKAADLSAASFIFA